ncbi:glutathione S-transferase family protein [Chondromyces apiculatus]|uniref:Glutathione S-transferase n=1 Tax=Chondromyces apiculatus DSM 436 TaxID=1192034 RepID=A0A017TE88_9BACT|nr:glutathione S-transferase family protein [Chondromyces apiculatus]EYF06931.1 Glutathione S-transferase [Chondromyces apiculatus DSM 436]
MKLETWLRLADIPYTIAAPDFNVAPKGKIPYVDDAGALMGDSTLIIEHLIATRGRDPDAGLSREERAISVAFRRLCKENLYWVTLKMRYSDPHNWSLYRPVLAGMQTTAPPDVKLAIADTIYRNMIEQLQNQGLGRHSLEEVDRIGMADLTALSDFLGAKPFLMGDRPTSVDATAYSHVANTIEVPLQSTVRDHGRALPNLVAYCERMRERFFPDLPRA